MLNVPNFLSLTRMPLALLFLSEQPLWRIIAIVAAMITDGLDGYLARRWQSANQIGAMLDPLMDRFFVFFALAVFIHEGNVTSLEMTALICRDFSVALFGLYLGITGGWARYKLRALWCGKAVTVLQLVVLLGLTLRLNIPSYAYWIFIILGSLALAELYLIQMRSSETRAKN